VIASPLPLRSPPALSTRFRPNAAGYMGPTEVAPERVARGNAHGAPHQPLGLLYNAPRHCDQECMYRQFLAMERDFMERPGEHEWMGEDGLLRDCHWRGNTTPFRTQRPPRHYQYAPPRKLLIEGNTYCLRDALSEPGYNRSLDGAEETQRLVVFSAMDPASPIGFFSFHRAVREEDDLVHLYLLPNMVYVAPPYRGLGYGVTLAAGVLEVWESELHYQAGRYRTRADLDVQVDAQALAHPGARPLLEKIRINTREALESCEAFWGCKTRRLAFVTDG
jgi:GNAT superfamily N-acetyltransferase